MNRSNKLLDITFIIFLFVIVATAFFSISPYRIPVPHRDSGIYLQIGSEILHGKVLYLQAWEMKQPLIFYFNAFGLWLGQGSIWGVWGLEIFFFLVLLSICYHILRLSLSPFKSFFVVFISFITIFQFMSGNSNEEFTLLFQAGSWQFCLFSIYRIDLAIPATLPLLLSAYLSVWFFVSSNPIWI